MALVTVEVTLPSISKDIIIHRSANALPRSRRGEKSPYLSGERRDKRWKQGVEIRVGDKGWRQGVETRGRDKG
jgi:hypothetical protein